MAFKCAIYGRVFSRPSNLKVIFKNCTPFEKCITEINNTQDNALDFDFAMVKYSLLKYGDNYLKTYASINIAEMNQFYIILMLLLTLQMITLLINSNLKKKQQVRRIARAQKKLK